MSVIKTMSLKKATAQFALFLTAIVACQPDNEILNSVDVQNVNSESAFSSLINENADIATKLISSLTNSQYSGARISSQALSLIDPRLTGATVTLYNTGTSTAPAGTIIIDFTSDGVTDDEKVTRKGQINITYAGKRWTAGSYYITKLINFYRNSAHIQGTDTTNFEGFVINGTKPDTLQIKLQSLDSAKITFGDGKSVEREGMLNKTWTRYVNINTGKIDPLQGELYITTDSGGTGKNTGKNKLNKTYTWNIDSPLVYNLPCWINNKVYIPVSGKINIKFDQVTTPYTVDYGDGTCDNVVTVSLNGRSKTITVTDVGN